MERDQDLSGFVDEAAETSNGFGALSVGVDGDTFSSAESVDVRTKSVDLKTEIVRLRVSMKRS